MAAVAEDSALIEFVYAEARLIDEKRLEEWYELFTDDGRYWMPLTRGQPNGLTENSLLFEDKLLLKVRIARLRNPHAYSQASPSWCQHVLQAPTIEDRGEGTGVAVTRTAFLYVESQRDHQEVYAGIVWHHLRRAGDRLALMLKKVELLNCEAALPSLQLFP
ncbi:MAG: aromatic-ring-hydroxylating dioxygenase subunit beta [Steroidobacteraceae bacterium]